MKEIARAISRLGEDAPIVSGGRGAAPDRREISARWLSGTFLTGMTSTVLMGIALYAALNGRQQLAVPAEIMALQEIVGSGEGSLKADRIVAPRQVAKARDRRRMELSTIARVGDSDVVRTMPFVQVSMALAASHQTDRSYPPFDPLSVFAETGPSASSGPGPGALYGAQVESEVQLKTNDFPVATANFNESAGLNADEVEEVVRRTGAILSDGAVQVAALHYVDPSRFGEEFPGQSVTLPYNVKIVQENVSIGRQPGNDQESVAYAEDFVVFRSDAPIAATLADNGYAGTDAAGMAEAIATLIKGKRLKAGSVLRLGIETRGEVGRIMRASLYDGSAHVLTIALNDRKQYVPAEEPAATIDVASALADKPQPVARVRSDLPTAYDGIYRAAFAYGLNRPMVRELVKLLSADVDLQGRIGPSDRIELFFSQPDDENRASSESQLLYVRTSFGGARHVYMRFADAKGTTAFFDENGRSARQFLLRSPVPTGEFRSGFGMRRHPILGYYRMHTGCDWAAPIGTPIIAAGNGTVEKAGWAGGYGRQTIIRHANGYETSYNHQSAFAKGVVPGAEVHQGQIIGYIGTSGLSTGPHLHYELLVNGSKVDPMRVRLPIGKELKGKALAAFQAERERIEALLDEGSEPGKLKLASR